MITFFNHIINIINSGVFWVVVGSFCFWFKKVANPLIKSHIRNNHENSLDNTAECIVNNLSKIESASPSDRSAEAITEMLEFASNRHIPFSKGKALGYLHRAKLDFMNKGGHFSTSKAEHFTKSQINQIQQSQEAEMTNNKAQLEASMNSQSNSANEVQSLKAENERLKEVNDK